MIEAPFGWRPLATAFRRLGKEFALSYDHKLLVAEALISGKLITRVSYLLHGEQIFVEVPSTFWKSRTPLWSTRQLRPHLVISFEELSSVVDLPSASTDTIVEVCEEHLQEVERLLKATVDRVQPLSPPLNAPATLTTTIELGGRSSKYDWGELAAVAANWIADNGPGVPRARLHRRLVEHAEMLWKASPDRRDLDRWIIDIQSTETGLPVSPSPIVEAKKAALGKKGYAQAAAIAGVWLDAHGLDADKSRLVDYLVQWFVASHAINPSRQDVETLVRRVYSLAKAR